MKFLKSTTNKSYRIEGITIPPCVTKDNAYAELGEDAYTKITSNPVGKALINAGGILVLSQKPANANASVESLATSNSELMAQNAALKTQLEALQAEAATTSSTTATRKALKESQALLSDAQAEIESLKAQLAAVTSTTEAEE